VEVVMGIVADQSPPSGILRIPTKLLEAKGTIRTLKNVHAAKPVGILETGHHRRAVATTLAVLLQVMRPIIGHGQVPEGLT
jgi:hypothetical protein